MKLYLEIKNKNNINEFNNEIQVFYTWCCRSLLILNVTKCKHITYSRKLSTQSVSITLGNEIVEKCNKIGDLAIILDSKLTFVDHYNTIIHRASNMLNFIERFSHHFQNPYTIKTLYVAYVRSILEYCSMV